MKGSVVERALAGKAQSPSLGQHPGVAPGAATVVGSPLLCHALCQNVPSTFPLHPEAGTIMMPLCRWGGKDPG